MATQAKCDACRIRLVWNGDRTLSKHVCPRCKGSLKATSYMMKKYPTIEQKPEWKILIPPRPIQPPAAKPLVVMASPGRIERTPADIAQTESSLTQMAKSLERKAIFRAREVVVRKIEGLADLFSDMMHREEKSREAGAPLAEEVFTRASRTLRTIVRAWVENRETALEKKMDCYSRSYPQLVGYQCRCEKIPPVMLPHFCPVCYAPEKERKNIGSGHDIVNYECGGVYEPKPQIQNHTDYWWGHCGKSV